MLIASDLHLDQHPAFGRPEADPRFPGCNSRAVEILKALERVYEAAKEGGHKYVVIPGDVFHRRGIVLVPLLNALCRMFEKAKAEYDIVTVVLPGNHDYVDRHARFESEYLHALVSMAGTVAVVSEPQLMKLKEPRGTILAGLIPYSPSKDVWRKRAQSLHALAGGVPGSARFVLFGHQSFDGAKVGPHEYVMKEGLGTLDVAEGVEVFSGHYHMPQSLGDWVHYVGSLIQQNFGERNYPVGFVALDADIPGFRRIENLASPRFVVVETDDPQVALDAKAAAAVRGDYLNVRFLGKLTDMTDLVGETRSDANVMVTNASPELPRSEARMDVTGVEAPVEVATKYVTRMAGLGRAPVAESKLVSAGRQILETARRNATV